MFAFVGASIYLLAATTATFQDQPPCGPFLNAMETTRLPEFGDDGEPTGRVMTVSYGESPTYEMTAVYYTPGTDGAAITYTMEGDLTMVNLRATPNNLKFRQSLRVPEGLTPFIAPDSPVCWDRPAERLVVNYEFTVPVSEDQIIEQIGWTIQYRKTSQIADINVDGVVDSLDQGLILSAWNSSDYLCDLNFDGVVNSGDLGIVFSQWSESSKEQ